ncbi:hypothetical protein PAJ34TS1_07560 [Paenibacillus azoreducens]|uniref:Uncharacterized protein n=1 Tax=Paenibacillus azoreducens TaxID=116718 RepID=A0A919YH40_9BACL|nr:hypothetical protein J34TS1_63410 [Paenibacillus azoreducens]
MKGETVSIDHMVIDFIDVYWDFFNEFHKRICHFYGVEMTVGRKASGRDRRGRQTDFL